MDLSRADLQQPIERAREAGPARRVLDVSIAVIRQVMDDDVLELSAALSYRFFMAIFPFAIFLIALSTFIAGLLGIPNPATQMKSTIGSSMPPALSSLLGDQLDSLMGRQSFGLLTFGAVAALFFASGGTSAVMKAANRAYDIEESRSIWRRYLVSIGVTLPAAFAVVVAFILFVAIQRFGHQIASTLGLGPAVDPILALAAWPVAFLLLLFAAMILYRVVPNLALPWHRVAVGAIVFTVGWLVATWGFAFYLGSIASYGATYGTLAGAVVLLVWLYITALILLVGAEVNAVLEAIAHPDDLQRGREDAREERRRAGAEVGAASTRGTKTPAPARETPSR